MNVVHVVTTLTTGGAERQLEMLVARSRHPATVVSLYETGPIADAVRASGHRVVELRATGGRKLLAPYRLWRLLRSLRPDVVHVHLLSAQALGIPAARLAGVPVVVSTEHSLMDDSLEGRPLTGWLRLLYRGLERAATHTVAVSDATAARLRRWGVRADRISVVDLGVDLEAVAHDPLARDGVRAEWGVAPATPVIGAVGRLVGIKRMDVVLRASAPLLRDGAVLVVAGTGPLEHDLRAQAVDLGVADRVHWLGARDAIGPVLSGLDVLVSASADETFGMAVVEAVGAGLPVAYAVCPALEALDAPLPQAAHVGPSGDADRDADALGAAVGRLLAGTAEHGGRWPVPDAVADRYGAQAAADRVDAVYERWSTAAHG